MTSTSSGFFGSDDLNRHSPGIESETSDYQRSTPSPTTSNSNNPSMMLRINTEHEKDLGFEEDFGNINRNLLLLKKVKSNKKSSNNKKRIISKVDEECRFSVLAAIASKRRSVEDRLALIRDPKIMRSRAIVKVEKLSQGTIDDWTAVKKPSR